MTWVYIILLSKSQDLFVLKVYSMILIQQYGPITEKGTIPLQESRAFIE